MTWLPLKRVAVVVAGQSPPSSEVTSSEIGHLPFLQGNAEFGVLHPTAVHACDSAPKRCESGDILLSVRAPVGALNVADRNYGIGRGLCAIRGTDVHSRYLWWALTSKVEDLKSRATGSTYTAVSADDVGSTTLRVPVPCEQRTIADYLDTETARIDALITKKRRMIELLEERWQTELDAVFTSASGLRFKRLLKGPLAYGVLVPQHEPDGVPMLRIKDFIAGRVDLEAVARIPSSLSTEYRRTIVEPGDLVVSVVGTLGTSAVIGPELAGCNLNRPLARVQLKPEVGRNLIRLWFASSQFRVQARGATSSDSAQPTLNLGDLKNFSVGLPSERGEWGALESSLLKKEQLHRAAIQTLQDQIGLLLERRQAMITAAVTGELEIPGVAAA